MKTYNLFKIQNWFNLHYDGRKSIFKGISKEDFNKAAEKAYSRYCERNNERFYGNRVAQFAEVVSFFKSVPCEKWVVEDCGFLTADNGKERYVATQPYTLKCLYRIMNNKNK